MMSTNTQPHATGVVQRRLKDGSRANVECPEALVLYNKYMGGVDHNDQLRKYYHVPLKSRKFYRYIFWFLFEVSVTNSYILYSNFCTHPNLPLNTLVKFRLQLFRELVGDYCSRKRAGQPLSGATSQPRSSLHFRHFPVKQKSTSKSGMSRCWYCYNCHRPKRRRETVWFCRECNLHLCHTGDDQDCFILYHKSLAV